MDRDELLRAKAAMSRRDRSIGKGSMKWGAVISAISLILVFVIVGIGGPLAGASSIVAYVLALGVGIGISMILYGAIQYYSGK